MTVLLLVIITLECLAMTAWGMSRRGRIYEFPFLAGVTWAGFVLPQLVGLRNDAFLPPGALAKTCLMVALCAAMGVAGYASVEKPFAAPAWAFSRKALLKLGLGFSLFGGYFFYLISRLPEEMTSGSSQWSGLPVAYLFFAHILTYGFAIAVFCLASRHSPAALGLSLFGAGFYLDRIVLAGRRGDTLDFTFILLMAWWFGKGKIMPRFLMLAAVLGGTLMLHSTGDYRGRVMGEKKMSLDSLREIPFVENLGRILREGGEELRSAVYEIHAADYHGRYDYGAFHWNGLVFNYVPQQLVGKGLKEGLMLKSGGPGDTSEFGFTAIPGATATGATDSFLSFWYFGCLKFFLIGYFMKRLYLTARRGWYFHQLVYALILASSLHTITHHTQWFVTPWVHYLLFLVPALWILRDRPAPLALSPVPA